MRKRITEVILPSGVISKTIENFPPNIKKPVHGKKSTCVNTYV